MRRCLLLFQGRLGHCPRMNEHLRTRPYPCLAIAALALTGLTASGCSKTAMAPTDPTAETAGESASSSVHSFDWQDLATVRKNAMSAEGLPAPADVAGPPSSALMTVSGLGSAVLRAGKGTVHPGPRDTVRCHYVGWQIDGKMFDSSFKHGDDPLAFPLYAVIAGWTEGVQLMVEGERRRFWIPSALAYKNRPGRPSGMLIFDVELVEIVK